MNTLAKVKSEETNDSLDVFSGYQKYWRPNENTLFTIFSGEYMFLLTSRLLQTKNDFVFGIHLEMSLTNIPSSMPEIEC